MLKWILLLVIISLFFDFKETLSNTISKNNNIIASLDNKNNPDSKKLKYLYQNINNSMVIPNYNN